MNDATEYDLGKRFETLLAKRGEADVLTLLASGPEEELMSAEEARTRELLSMTRDMGKRLARLLEDDPENPVVLFLQRQNSRIEAELLLEIEMRGW